MAPSQPLTASALHALLANAALTGEWVLDPRRSSLRLKSRIMGLIQVRGVFGEVSGSGTVSPEGEVSGSITAMAASIDTKNKKRDKHLRSADFFDSEQYPGITFAVDGVEPRGGTAITGALSVRGCTRPLSFDASISRPGDGEVWLDAEVQINRAYFGVAWNRMGLVSMNSTLTAHTVFTRR
jgi:polyisoprenoid-binding protein YceI